MARYSFELVSGVRRDIKYVDSTQGLIKSVKESINIEGNHVTFIDLVGYTAHKRLWDKNWEGKTILNVLDELQEAADKSKLQTLIEEEPIYLPPTAQLVKSKILGNGAKKYGTDSWKKLSTQDHLNHALRHILLFMENKDISEDHLGNAACRLDFAIETNLIEKESDKYEASRRQNKTQSAMG